MANKRENRMNLAALQRVDSTITKILDNATQVALYNFSPKKGEWEKTEIEGTLFVYNRSETPRNGFIVMNRLNTTNLIESLSEELDFQIQTPFLLYRNAKSGDIRGIWFYNKEECEKIGQLVNRLAKLSTPDKRDKMQHVRPRCSSESDSLNKPALRVEDSKAVDIVSLLSRAQDEYDKRTKTDNHSIAGGKIQEPKVMLEEPCTEGPKSKDIIRPKPVRATNGVISGSSPQHAPSIAHLFAQACATKDKSSSALQNGQLENSPRRALQKSQSLYNAAVKLQHDGNSGTPLQRLMSNPANMVEHIERLQLNETVGPGHRARAPSFSDNAGAGNAPSKTEADVSAQSLEHDLKEKLHLLPKTETTASIKQGAASPSYSPTRIFHLSPLNASPVTILNNHYGSFHSGPTKVPIMPTPLFTPSQSSVGSVPILTPAMFEKGIHYSPPQHSPLGSSNLPVSVNSSVPSNPGNFNGSFADPRFSGTATSAVPPPATSVPLLSPMVFTTSINQPTLSAELPLANTVQCGQGSAPVSLPLLGTNNAINSSLLHGGLPQSDVACSELLLPQQIEAPIAHGQAKEPISPGISPLTKDQLKEAFMYMLNNDDDFLGKLHEAYVTTLKSRLNRFSS